MKKLSQDRLAEVIVTERKRLGLNQESLCEQTGINRSMISRIERKSYIPTIPQLEKLAEVLQFDLNDLFLEEKPILYTSFRGAHFTKAEQEAEERMMEMIFAARQQLLLRKAYRDA